MSLRTCAELLDAFGGNVLTVCCRYVYTPELMAVVRNLFNDNFVDVNESDYNGRNALLALLDNNKFINEFPESALEIVNLLISSGSNARQIDENEESALWKLAYASTDPKTVFPIAQVLLANGVDINLNNPVIKYNAAVLFLSKRDDKLSHIKVIQKKRRTICTS